MWRKMKPVIEMMYFSVIAPDEISVYCINILGMLIVLIMNVSLYSTNTLIANDDLD